MLTVSNAAGEIHIAGDVLTCLAGDAATSCFGVKGMVACAKEGGPWQLLRRELMSKGVIVHYEEDGSVSVELHIGVDRSVNIAAVCRSIIKQTAYKLQEAAGIPVKAVHVYVDSIIG